MGRYAVYDVRTLQVFAINAEIAALLTSPCADSSSDEQRLRDLLLPLQEKGLVSLGPNDNQSLAICDRSSCRVVLAVAADCNHRCSYCWNGYGRFGKDSGIMRSQVAVEVTNKIFSAYPECGTLELEYYGGEPLLGWDAISASVARAEELAALSGKTVHFSLTTNGSLLTRDIADYLTKHKFWVAVSIDGEKNVHDRHRHLADGSSSWEAAVRGARRLQEFGLQPAIRATISTSDTSLLSVRDYLSGLLFDRVIVECVDERLYGQNSSDHVTELAQHLYEQYAVEMVERQRSGASPSASVAGCMVDHMIEQLWNGRGRDNGCGLCQDRTVAFDVAGQPYPCRPFLNNGPWMLRHERARDQVAPLISSVEAACGTCPIKRLCGGGCIAIKGIGADWEQHCERIRCAVRCAMWILCELSSLGGDVVKQLVAANPTR